MRDFEELVTVLRGWAGEQVVAELLWEPSREPIADVSGVLGRGDVAEVLDAWGDRLGRAMWIVGDGRVRVDTFSLMEWAVEGTAVEVRIHDNLLLRVVRQI